MAPFNAASDGENKEQQQHTCFFICVGVNENYNIPNGLRLLLSFLGADGGDLLRFRELAVSGAAGLQDGVQRVCCFCFFSIWCLEVWFFRNFFVDGASDGDDAGVSLEHAPRSDLRWRAALTIAMDGD